MALGGALGSVCSTFFMVNKHYLVYMMQALRDLHLLHDSRQAFRASGKSHQVIGFIFEIFREPLLNVFLETKIDTADDECVTGMGRHRGLL
jgi:hypothetical protein